MVCCRRLDSNAIVLSPEAAADRRTAMHVGQRVDLDDMRPVDLVVTGSVAVNSTGARIGKGAGYGDIDVALLAAADLLGRSRPPVRRSTTSRSSTVTFPRQTTTYMST